MNKVTIYQSVYGREICPICEKELNYKDFEKEKHYTNYECYHLLKTESINGNFLYYIKEEEE